jgi:hypothetical protein
MTLKTIFEKPVDRPIEGVIKADDEASLRLELEEYVLTQEVEKRLESFLSAYNHYEVANGVWVSGFFGSGKSHLLKVLALLLENRTIDGMPALDLFLPKCKDNEILRADLKKAAGIPSKSILFNIDQKADVISKTQIDALLAVFVKVFDEMCGYYGKQGHIAQFERDLDSRKLYVPFQDAYAAVAGRPWQTGREQALLESRNVAKAYAQVTGEDDSAAAGILDKYRNQYRVSIEDFAEQIKAYVERQSPDFRLNFFVDEAGQYIADNTKLMTNLQTIAESLATKCRGRSWIVVTAQEEMHTVVGEMSRQQGNDFSKIQARFANRMKLTSADVAEVIQKRLLMKNKEGVMLLTDIYHEQVNNFRTLFGFADGSATYRNFQDQEHFIHSYPFIPYQFALFQSAIQNLSQHNAFEGKHSSVGERSMLGVFQQVAIKIGDHRMGQLATFDLMFEGIRTAMKANIQRAILQAEKHLDDDLAIRLLKALFLVKYVREFKATPRNLSVLMLDRFDQDLSQLRKLVEEALNRLEQQTYVQRTGDLYHYLTDEEKDVEQEIKGTEVEADEVAAELERLIFDGIIKTRKIRYTDNKQDYSYSKKLDDRLRGREHELAIHVITPFHENVENETTLKMQGWERDELLVLMPPDDRLVRDLLMYKRTEKYIRQNVSVTQNEAVKRILTDKGHQNHERQAELLDRARTLIGKAKMFVAGHETEVSQADALARIVQGFQDLIARTYPNLRMLRGIPYTENDIAKHLRDVQKGLSDDIALSEAEQEMMAFIQSNNRGGVRTTLKSIVEKFERKPNGWYYAAILCILAKLCARGKVEIRRNSNLLEGAALEQALRNTHEHPNIVVEPQETPPPPILRKLKEFFGDFFATPAPAGEAKTLGKATAAAMQELLLQLTELAAQKDRYPFLSALDPVVKTVKASADKPYEWYWKELARQRDTLLDMKENIIDPLEKFMGGPQKTIYDEAGAMVQTQQPNFPYLGGDLPQQIETVLRDPQCFRGNRMQQLKSLVDTLKEQLARQMDAEITIAQDTIATLEARLCGMPEYARLGPEQQQTVCAPFTRIKAAIIQNNLIAVIRDTLRRFEESDYPHLLQQVASGAASEGTTVPPPPAKPIAYVPIRSVSVSFDKAWLADEDDLDRYLEAMREASLVYLKNGKRIQI